MPGFLGSYRHQLDAQGRVSLPALFRKDRMGAPFVLLQTTEDALSLYPEEKWAEVEEQLREMSKRQPRYAPQLLRISSQAVPLVPDAQGRILIPERLREAISLRADVLVVGAMSHIQLWEPKRFEAVTSARDEEFEKHLGKVFA